MDNTEQLSIIKKAGETDKISREEFERRILEIAKCKRDICYFAKKYFKIINLDIGLTTINPYPKQEELLKFFVNEKRCICLASRQTGKCVFKNTKITVKNKKDGEIKETTIEDFYKLCSKSTIFFNTSYQPDTENEFRMRRDSSTKKLSDAVQRKFIDSRRITEYEILTDDGWIECTAIHKTIPYKVWSLATEQYRLLCADDHIVFDDEYHEIFVKDIRVGDFIWTERGLDCVTEVSECDIEDNMYDVELCYDSKHRYYTNGILSHNTTSYTIYALWMLIFHCEKKIMLLANKADTALEILGRIKMAYEYLPAWLKPGMVTMNKGEMIFSNKSAIKGFATASDAARGYSANCVDGNSIIWIRHKCLKWLRIPIKIKWLKYFFKVFKYLKKEN